MAIGVLGIFSRVAIYGVTVNITDFGRWASVVSSGENDVHYDLGHLMTIDRN